MKVKQLIVVAAATMLAVGAYAQGLVTFQNGTASRCYYTNTIAGLPNPSPFIQGLPVSNSWGTVAGLYYSTDTNAIANPGAVADSFTMLATTANISPTASLAGVFAGGSRGIPGTASGQMVVLQIRAWSGGAADYEAARASQLAGNSSIVTGYSTPILLILGGGSLPTPGMATGGLTPMTPFFVSPVPEPSVVALGVLGLLGVLFIRRRK